MSKEDIVTKEQTKRLRKKLKDGNYSPAKISRKVEICNLFRSLSALCSFVSISVLRDMIARKPQSTLIK